MIRRDFLRRTSAGLAAALLPDSTFAPQSAGNFGQKLPRLPMSAWGAGQTKTERVVGAFFCTCEVKKAVTIKA